MIDKAGGAGTLQTALTCLERASLADRVGYIRQPPDLPPQRHTFFPLTDRLR